MANEETKSSNFIVPVLVLVVGGIMFWFFQEWWTSPTLVYDVEVRHDHKNNEPHSQLVIVNVHNYGWKAVQDVDVYIHIPGAHIDLSKIECPLRSDKYSIDKAKIYRDAFNIEYKFINSWKVRYCSFPIVNENRSFTPQDVNVKAEAMGGESITMTIYYIKVILWVMAAFLWTVIFAGVAGFKIGAWRSSVMRAKRQREPQPTASCSP